ncbi:hypothetical protein ACJX0J_026797, partial [Zea mays]
ATKHTGMDESGQKLGRRMHTHNKYGCSTLQETTPAIFTTHIKQGTVMEDGALAAAAAAVVGGLILYVLAYAQETKKKLYEIKNRTKNKLLPFILTMFLDIESIFKKLGFTQVEAFVYDQILYQSLVLIKNMTLQTNLHIYVA